MYVETLEIIQNRCRARSTSGSDPFKFKPTSPKQTSRYSEYTPLAKESIRAVCFSPTGSDCEFHEFSQQHVVH
ncbi:hypothetical protein CY34DRAFT_809444 [Suillus luteus UH-Slu-Lm8-n1]|uniref:Unplaced genomic scaffold CY34scaffold_267, whole genome shotgun sequence n=1 Tax=Suillus luteus UH-Slu-Lm8-n1 TaxID=930992 RepID=A0A0D0AJM1_9AGAM|nr:hypothetical protein CY34DRAFT_809444 [Suillus luteus UH-Slu-Lm8-n1]